MNFRLGVFILPTKAPFFIWWAVLPNIYEIISLATRDYMPYVNSTRERKKAAYS